MKKSVSLSLLFAISFTLSEVSDRDFKEIAESSTSGWVETSKKAEIEQNVIENNKELNRQIKKLKEKNLKLKDELSECQRNLKSLTKQYEAHTGGILATENKKKKKTKYLRENEKLKEENIKLKEKQRKAKLRKIQSKSFLTIVEESYFEVSM